MEEKATLNAAADGRRLAALTTAMSSFAFCLFAVAVPMLAYMMLRVSETFEMKRTLAMQFVDLTFPWLTFLLAFAVPVALMVIRKRASDPLQHRLVAATFAGTLMICGAALCVTIVPVISLLNALQ